MKAVVTGGCGFIGFNLCKELCKRGWEVTVVDNLSSGYDRNYVSGFNYVYSSITQACSLASVESWFIPDVVFHLAAIPRVSYSVREPHLTAETNVLGTVYLLDWLRRKNPEARFIFSSSSSVYGGATELPTREMSPLLPKSPYALQKAQAEDWCRMFHDLYGMKTVILRYFNVFGPHSLFGGAYSTVLSAWLYHLYVNSHYKPYLEGDGHQTRDFCFVDNAVQANILAAEADIKQFGDAFNISQGGSVSLLECASMLETISGKQLVLENRPDRVGDVRHTQADITKAQQVLGYHPDLDFARQLKKMAEWYETSYPADLK